MDLKHFTVTVPANTSATNPLIIYNPMTSGKIIRVEVDIPAGHAYLTGLQIWHEGRPLYPDNPNEWLTGDDDNIAIISDYIVKGYSLQKLQFKAYNVDTNLTHTFRVRMSLIQNYC